MDMQLKGWHIDCVGRPIKIILASAKKCCHAMVGEEENVLTL